MSTGRQGQPRHDPTAVRSLAGSVGCRIMIADLGADTPAARPGAPGTRLTTVSTAGGQPPFDASVGPAVTVLRWASVGFGVVAVAPQTGVVGWTDVLLLAICVFLTTLRTIMPLELGATDLLGRLTPVIDVTVFAVVVGWSGATESPWLLCLLTAVGLAAYGWGRHTALVSGVVAVVGVTVAMGVSGATVADRFDDTSDLLATVSLALAASGGLYLRMRAIETARLLQRNRGELTRLEAANALLEQLTEVALTLPGAFTLREALERTRQLLQRHLDPRTIVLLTLDEPSGEWTPKMTDRVSMRSAYHRNDLPAPLLTALEAGSTRITRVGGSTSSFIGDESRSGIYMVLRARGQVIGLLALEHQDPGHFETTDPLLREGLGELIALTIDNARWFARLRSLGAEEERLRLARDVHDRLGQWMTYLKLELERISNSDPLERSEIRRLHDDAAFALDELRETLRQLRSGVSDDRPLSVLGGEFVERFADRSDVAARFIVTHPDQRLPVPVENEILRILQEALNNVDRHADAHHVQVTWTVDGGDYALVVTDDGCGFDPDAAVREQSYGLVGMRERAEVIGATFEITSKPGAGTRLEVRAGIRARRADGAEATVVNRPRRQEIPT